MIFLPWTKRYFWKDAAIKKIIVTSNPAESKTCEYKRFDNVARWEGNGAGLHVEGKTQEECEKICDSIQDCNSFAYSDNSGSTVCWFKKKKLYGFEEQTVNSVFPKAYTVYKVCQNEMMTTENARGNILLEKEKNQLYLDVFGSKRNDKYC